MLAVLEGRLDQGFGGAVGAADQFGDNIDIVPPGKRGGVIAPGNAGKLDAPVLGFIAGADRRHNHVAAAAGGKDFAILAQYFKGSGAHRAKAGNADPERRRSGRCAQDTTARRRSVPVDA